MLPKKSQKLFFIACMLLVLLILVVAPLFSSLATKISSNLHPLSVSAQTFSCDSVTSIPWEECNALVVLFNSTGGPFWYRKDNWMVTNEPCSWQGLMCSGGHVTWIEMFGNNLVGNLPPDLSNLSQLILLSLPMNNLSGPIPPELGNLTNLQVLILHQNHLTGPIPPELGNLTNLTELRLYTNHLTGPIPPELGNLIKLQRLVLKSNFLSGSIPPELGNLANLTALGLSSNQLNGEIPRAIVNLVKLYDYFADLGYNMLTTSDPAIIDFLEVQEKDPDWAQTQTVPPTDLQVVTSPSLQLTWTPITYTADGGYYEVNYATTSGGPYTVLGTTTDKTVSSYPLDALPPGSGYYLRLRTYTPAHGQYSYHVYQQSDLWSDFSDEVQFGVIRGDLDSDGDVDISDLIMLLQNWGDKPSVPAADLSGDSKVNGLDFVEMLSLLP